MQDERSLRRSRCSNMCRRASGGTDTIGCFVVIVFYETEATWREGKTRGVHVHNDRDTEPSSNMQYT
jgi:hypothetical protein